jgi:Ulp1 family protease
LPTSYADDHAGEWSSLNTDDIGTLLSSLRFSTHALRKLKIFRDSYLNINNTITSEQYDLDCETAHARKSKAIGNHDITKKDLKAVCTDTDAWLNDDALNIITRHMAKNSTGIVAFSTLAVASLQATMLNEPHKVDKKVQRMLTATVKEFRTTKGHVELVVGCLNIHETHWVSYAIDSVLQQILYIDSYGAGVSVSYRKVLHTIKVAFFGDTAMFKEIHNNSVVQLDGWACGFHVLWAMQVFTERLHRDLDPAYFVLRVSENTMKYARRWVLRKLLEIAPADVV